PTTGSMAIIGECTYGVLGAKKTPFLLRHYPKAVAGSPDEIRKLQPKQEIPFEIQLAGKGEDLTFIALRNGKPIPNAAFIAVGYDLKDHNFKANPYGSATWKPA